MINLETQHSLRSDIETLKSEILSAFHGVETPDTKILMPYDEHENAIVEAFCRKHWSMVDLSTPAIFSSPALYLLHPEWFHFYLPAYMLASLSGENAGMFARNVLGVLTPPADLTHTPSSFALRMQLLTREQRKTVALFVDYMKNKYSNDPKFYAPFPKLIDYWFGTKMDQT